MKIQFRRADDEGSVPITEKDTTRLVGVIDFHSGPEPRVLFRITETDAHTIWFYVERYAYLRDARAAAIAYFEENP